MNCDTATLAISARADGELDAGADAGLTTHLASCTSCQRFESDVATIRRGLRVEPLDALPDLAGRVSLAIANDGQRPRTARRAAGLLRVAAVVLVGVLLGGVVTRLAARPEAAGAADLSAQVLVAQRAVDALTARIEVTERGLRPEVPQRTFSGTLAYRAPDHVALDLTDRTDYPPGWVPNDLTVVAKGSTWWTRGVRSCPRLPGCTPAEPRLVAVTGSEPFADEAPRPLELVVPVRSLALSAPTPIEHARIRGMDVIGARVTAAQIQPLLDTLHLAGNLREVHPADPVTLWLTPTNLIPVEVAVEAADSPARRSWAASRSYTDLGGETILRVALSALRVNSTIPPGAFPDPPSSARRFDLGFGSDPAAAFGPARLEGLERTHAGRTTTAGGAPTETTAWSDGRSYLVARRTTQWPGRRLFGDLGEHVAIVELGEVGIGYTTPDGSRLAIHTEREDLVIFGSVSADTIRRAARQLGVRGEAIPDGWQEVSAVTLDEARQHDADLVLPARLDGYGEPAVAADEHGIHLTYAGAGARTFTLHQRRGTTPAAPAATAVIEITVRAVPGHYQPVSGTLTWTEQGRTLALESPTLSLPELLDVAENLRP